MCQVITSHRPLQRSIRRIERPTSEHPTGTVRVAVGREVAFYGLTELVCQFDECRAFRLVKHDPERPEYRVPLNRNGQDCSCECMGFLRHNRCKHVGGLASLL